MVKILKFRSDFRVTWNLTLIRGKKNKPHIFQDMLSCLITERIYTEEQKLISFLNLYVKSATLRLELLEE